MSQNTTQVHVQGFVTSILWQRNGRAYTSTEKLKSYIHVKVETSTSKITRQYGL
jgi:hypothetical protein